MRTLAVNNFMSLDGVMQAPGTPEEDPTGGFTLGGWSVNYWDDVMGEAMALHSGTYELLLGRGTYEIFAAHWPYAGDDPTANELNSARKHVASTTHEEVTWNNSTRITGDVSEYVARLKDKAGPEIQVHGSWGLIQRLLAHDLVDESRLFIFPLVIGKGKRLFGDGTIPAGLKLVDSKLSTTGVIIATYERAGDIEPGSFGLEQPSDAELERRRRLAEG